MADIVIKSSQDLENVIQTLTRLREDFHNKAAEIDSEEKRLIDKWKGDASTAFNERWTKEYTNFDALYNLLGDYINGLTRIKETYERAEQTNINIANQ